jgi:branched-chain amino acid transport system permease protein
MRPGSATGRVILLHLAVVAALFALQFVLPVYHHGVFARVMVLAVFAMGYNIVFGYTGLLSLGHAMFFCAGLYGAGLTVYHLDWAVPPAFLAGLASGLVLALGVGVLALRTTGVAFLIVTLMFGQIFYLLTLYFAEYTRGDDGIVLSQAMRRIHLGDTVIDLTNPATRYFVAWALFSVVLFVTLALVRAPLWPRAGRDPRERGAHPPAGLRHLRSKLSAMAVSGVICAAAGAAYALLFGYAGASFAEVHFSILPLLWVLVGGAATVLGPILGTLLMFYLVDFSNDLLNAYFQGWNLSYLGVVGVALVCSSCSFPRACWARCVKGG